MCEKAKRYKLSLLKRPMNLITILTEIEPAQIWLNPTELLSNKQINQLCITLLSKREE